MALTWCSALGRDPHRGAVDRSFASCGLGLSSFLEGHDTDSISIPHKCPERMSGKGPPLHGEGG